MKNLFSLLLISAMATACVNLDGQLNILQKMTVKKKSGFLNLGTKNVDLAAGIYNASLKVNNTNSFTIKLRLDKENDNDILIPIKSEKDLNLPSNGAVRIAGADISQPFDLNGTITTSYSNSGISRTSETCSVTTYQRRCERECVEVKGLVGEERAPRGPEGRPGTPDRDPRRPDQGRPARPPETRCDVVCRDVPVSIFGTRLVDYHLRYTTRNLEVEFRDTKNQAQVATFSANGTESDTVNDYYGECRI